MSGVHHQMMAVLGGLSQVELGSNQNVSDTDTPAAVATVTVRRDGTVVFGGDTVPANFDWASPKFSTVGDAFEVLATVVSGDSPSSGTTGSWQALTSDRSWGYTQTLPPGGNLSGVLRISIGYIGTSTALDTVDYSMTATIA